MTEVLFKVLIIGLQEVGKTSFVQRYVYNRYRGTYKVTMGGKVILLNFLGTVKAASHECVNRTGLL